jgi:hypothetical protein
MIKTSTRRKRIFEVFSNNLRFVSEKLEFKFAIESNGIFTEFNDLIYICPLCKEIFIEECLDQTLENPLTLEDVPPSKLGGKPLILTCKKCNNNAGTKLDRSLINHLKESEFILIREYGEVKSKISINNSPPIRSIIKRGINKEWIFQIDFKNPIVEKQLEYLKHNWDGSEVNFSFSITSHDLVSSALLRIGYLIAFHYFGNQLLIAENIQPIIEQIRYPQKKILSHTGITELKIADKVDDGLHVLVQPKECKCYFVVFTLKLDQIKRQFGVFIPGPGQEGWNNYQNINDLKKHTIVNFKDISYRDMVNNKERVDGYTQLWKFIL